jgi:membrane-bound serine protease (ClpP class)
MRTWLTPIAALALVAVPAPLGQAPEQEAESAAQKKVYVVPVRDHIMPPILYIIRRGVKEAMAAEADCLILDMETNGGRVDITEEIVKILDRFKGETVTFVNEKAISAGAIIALGTGKIYLSPSGRIGDAKPILMGPGGGVQTVDEGYEEKINSYVRALGRSYAQKNGHNPDVAEAMIDASKVLKFGEEEVCAEGKILTLTAEEAVRRFGDPPMPLLSSGTVENIDALIIELGYAGAQRVDVAPLGVEELGTWINAISPILLLIGIIGLYIEFKTAGFGVFGAVGIAALVLYFFGGYVSGLAGIEWVGIFAVGVALVAVELFLLPGTIFIGLIGVVCMFVALVMGMTDLYPMPWFPAGEGEGGGGVVPQVEGIDFVMPDFSRPIHDLLIAFGLAVPIIWALAKFLPHTALFAALTSSAASGVESVAAVAAEIESRLGQAGTSTTPLNPGGKGMFGDALCNVITQGEMIAAGTPVKVIGHRGSDLLVIEA